MPDRHETTLVFDYDADARAAAVAEAVAREAGDVEGDRTEAAVARNGATVTVRVAAADLVALRAGQNTWCSLVAVAERTVAAADRVG